MDKEPKNSDPKKSTDLPERIQVVNIPLTEEEDKWLREQKKKVYETYGAYKKQTEK